MWRLGRKAYLVGKRCIHAGDKISGWTVERVSAVPEFNITACLLKHKSGSELLHLHRPDQNATFSVGFRTVPTDSTGLPHILEHTVLCGSKTFPCRDPFFKMLNRSLATFMNASTGPDYTFYPFSTQNQQDFRNLETVYLDAVFRPNLANVDFRQEGWRLEHADPFDNSTPIILKGIVFNEMKGVFSDKQNRYGDALLHNILPSHTYAVVYGGDPIKIPSLKHEDLISFHSKHYTPANARFYIYGDVTLKEHLQSIEKYLEGGGNVISEVPREVKWTEPRRKHIPCRFDLMAADSGKQGTISISYLCSDIKDTEETFILSVISELLVKGPNASFYQTLVEPGIGAGLSPVTGYESGTRDTFFTVGLQELSSSDFDKVEAIIEKTFKDVLENGFAPERIEAVLHGMELGLKHQTSNFGLALLFAVMPLWNHGGDIVHALRIEDQIRRLRVSLEKDPKFLQRKVEEYFVNNTHKLVLTMSPDAAFEAEQKKMEEELLMTKLAKLTDEDKKRLYLEGLELIESQKVENKNILPTLTMHDIPRDIVEAPVQELEMSGVPVFYFPQQTNGVTYFKALIPTDGLPSHLQPYLPLFAIIGTRMGTKKHNFRDFDQLVSLHTGGLSMGNHVLEDADGKGFEGSLTLSSYCLDRNIPRMFQLWEEALQELDLSDMNRFSTLVKDSAANSVNSVAGNGHSYAMLAAGSLVSNASALSEEQDGLTSIKRLKDLAGGDLNMGLKHMIELRAMLKTAKIRCSINAMPETNFSELTRVLERLGMSGCKRQIKKCTPLAPQLLGKFYELPFDVSYTGMAIPTVPYLHPDFAPLRILTKYLTSKYFHPEIREKGGAYGGGAILTSSGQIRFYSYRDPNPANSLRIYDGSADWIGKNVPVEEDLVEAKLGIFQAVDKPVAPGARGSLFFMYGITDDMLREHRQKLKAVTAEDVVRVSEKFLKNPTHAGRCVLGPKNNEIAKEPPYQWITVDA